MWNGICRQNGMCVWSDLSEAAAGSSQFCTLKKTSPVSNSLFFLLLVHISRIQQCNENCSLQGHFLLFCFGYMAGNWLVMNVQIMVKSNNSVFPFYSKQQWVFLIDSFKVNTLSFSLSLVPRFWYERKLVSWVFHDQINIQSTLPYEARKGHVL